MWWRSWYSFACSFGAVAENCLLWWVAVSKELGKIVGIIGAGADVWVILVYILLNGACISKLVCCVVECSENVPCIYETWAEHASEWVDSHHLLSWETWSHGHNKEFNDELSIWRDFSKESLPSSISHCYSFSSAGRNDFWTAVERNVVHLYFFFK